MNGLWDISAIAAVGVLVAWAVVRHFRKALGSKAGSGCGGGCCKTPGSGSCG